MNTVIAPANDLTVDAGRAHEVANTIRRQLGVWGLAVVGASNLYYTVENMGGLVFTGRLRFTGQTRVRNMLVRVILNGADLYDVVVDRPDGVRVLFAGDVDAANLHATMDALDLEGVPTD